ncbi:hypothetical protein JHK82_040293 [Glycine max]|nr:hypothetical protein JHK82_040293 [Glycine max]
MACVLINNFSYAGIEARGFIFGPPIALAIGTKFVPLRKPKKLPAHIESSYELRKDINETPITVDAEKEIFDLVFESDESIFSLSQPTNVTNFLYLAEGSGGLTIWDNMIGITWRMQLLLIIRIRLADGFLLSGAVFGGVVREAMNDPTE